MKSNIGSGDDGSLKNIQTQYVVTPPEHAQISHKPKEHFIFGGTQIVEVGTTLGNEQYSREKNQNAWNGKFVYESVPERTVLKSWTKQSTSIDPKLSVATTTTTKEEVVSTETGANTLKKDVTTESTKMISDTMDEKSKNNKKSERNLNMRFDIDVTDNANATDLLLESERCIAKKAYVTTDKDEQNVPSTSTASNIESQILSNKSHVDTSKTTTKFSADTYKADASHIATDTKLPTIDTKANNRYAISTVPFTSNNIPDSNTTLSSLDKSNDTSNRFSTEQYSQSFSASSRTEKASSSNKVIEIVDGKERVVSDTFNESGSTQSKSQQENYIAKYGTGITPQVEYDHKLVEENMKFEKDRRDKEPIFDRNYRDSHRHIKQTGENSPVEYLKGSYETTRFDDKTKKYVTDVRHYENNRQLDHSTNITDSIQSKHDIETSRLSFDNNHGAIRNELLYGSTVQSSYDSNLNDHSNTVATISENISNDYTRTAKSDSIDSKSLNYTTKLFDNKTNTWKGVDEHRSNEINKNSTMQKPSDIDRQSPTRSIDSIYKIETSKINDKNVISDLKTANEKRTSRTSRTDTKSITKTIDENVTQHLYDEKTKTWREVDEKTIKSKRPSLIRYVSKDNDGKFTTIYKRKLFDKRSGTWKVVDEKVYKNNNFNEHIPEVIEDVTNVTTTTYTTKVYDTKTNTWRVVDEQTFTDRNTVVPKDIADEIARDQPDIANITTTTELTKVRKYGRFHFSPFLPSFWVFLLNIWTEIWYIFHNEQ